MKIRFAIILCSLVLGALACGELMKGPNYPGKVTPEIEKAFAQAELLYKKGSYQAAADSYQRFLTSTPYNRLSDEAIYKVGKISFLLSRWDAAIENFLNLTKKSPDREYRAKGFLMAGYAALKKGDGQYAFDILARVDPGDLPTKLELQYYSLKVAAGKKISVPRDVLDFAYLRMADIYQGSADRSLPELRVEGVLGVGEVMERVEAWVTSPLDLTNIPSWMRNYPPGFSKGFVEYKLGKIYYEAEQNDRARNQLSKFVRAYPKNRYAESARQLLEKLGGTVALKEGDRLRVGVLLPLSGPRAAFGQATLHGIECACGKLPGCERISSEAFGDSYAVDLVVRDSGSDPEQLGRLIDELKGEGVSVIVGPMSASLAARASEEAQREHVVLFPFTQKTSDMSKGGFVFQMGYEASEQMGDLVREARSRGLKTFGIFYPDNTYGKEMAELFSREVEAQGGRVAARAPYQPGSPDLTGQVHRLKLGMNRVSYGDAGVGFQALFVPDSYGMVGRLIPALQLAGIHDIPLIGTNAWSNPKLTSDLLESYPGSFFVDLFYWGDRKPLTMQFVSSFSSSVGHTPTSIEALGFDAAWFARKGASLAGSTKSGKIRDALAGLTDLQGVTSIKNFSEGTDPVVSPYVLRVTAAGIQKGN